MARGFKVLVSCTAPGNGIYMYIYTTSQSARLAEPFKKKIKIKLPKENIFCQYIAKIEQFTRIKFTQPERHAKAKCGSCVFVK